MSTYKYKEPNALADRPVMWLKVIKKPVWEDGRNVENIPDDLIIGSITWLYYSSDDPLRRPGGISALHIENNRFGVNFEPKCFVEISDPRIIVTTDSSVRYFKPQYRFKTKEEFIAQGLWNSNGALLLGGYPKGWNNQGEMNHYLGQIIPANYQSDAERGGTIRIHRDVSNGRTWKFDCTDYTSLPLPIKKYESFDVNDWGGVVQQDFTSKSYVDKPKRYRFLTEQEFKDQGRWGKLAPERWSYAMAQKFLGKEIPREYTSSCELKSGFTGEDGWWFDSKDYKEIREAESQGWVQTHIVNPCAEIFLGKSGTPSKDIKIISIPKAKKKKIIVVESTTNITV